MIYYTFNGIKNFISIPQSLENLKQNIIEEEYIDLKDDEILNCYTRTNKLIENNEDYRKLVQPMSTLISKIEKKKMENIKKNDDDNINNDNKKDDEIINENQFQNLSSNENLNINKLSMIIIQHLEKQKKEICEFVTEKMKSLIKEKINNYITNFEKEQNENKTKYNEINKALKNIDNKLKEIQDNNNINQDNHNIIVQSLNNVSSLISDIFQKITLIKNNIIKEIKDNYHDIATKIKELKNNNKINENINLGSFNSSLKKNEPQKILSGNKNNNNSIYEKSFQNIISQIKILKENNIEYNNNNKQFNNILNVLNSKMNELKKLIQNSNIIIGNKNENKSNVKDEKKKNNDFNKEIKINDKDRKNLYKASLKILNKKNEYKFKDISENKEIIKIEIKNEGNIKIQGNCYIKTINDYYYIPKTVISNTINPNKNLVCECTILCKNVNNPSPQENVKIILCDGEVNEICSINLRMIVEFEDDSIQLSQLNLDFNSIDGKNNDNDNSLLNVTKYTKEKIKKLQEFFDGKTINQLKDAIKKNNGDVDKAIYYLIDQNS